MKAGSTPVSCSKNSSTPCLDWQGVLLYLLYIACRTPTRLGQHRNGDTVPLLAERNRASGLWHILSRRKYCQITEKLRRLVWKGGEYCLFQSIDKFGKMHYTSLKRYHCFGKTAHSWLSLSQFSVADTAGEPFLFSKSGHFRYVLQSLLRRSARMAGMLRLISGGGK